MTKKVKVPGGGPAAAADLLPHLDSTHSKKLLDQISQQDPEMAKYLQENMVSFEDLRHLTVSMIRDLLKEVPLAKLGLALRMGSRELREHLLAPLSSGMKSEIEEVLLGPPRPASEVQKSMSEIMEIVRAKLETGELIVKPDDSDPLV